MRNVLFKALNFGHEEGYSIVIWEQNGGYFMRTQGHNVETGDFDTREKISSDEALSVMLEEVEFEDDGYLNLPLEAA